MEATVTHSSALVADAGPDVITSLEESDGALASIVEATITPTESSALEAGAGRRMLMRGQTLSHHWRSPIVH